MKTKFLKGERVIIANHPNRSMIGKKVIVEAVAHGRFQEGVGYVDRGVYKVSLGGKNIGWAPEEDLKETINNRPLKQINMDRQELVEVFARFLNENGMWCKFEEWLEKQGYSVSEFEFPD